MQAGYLRPASWSRSSRRPPTPSTCRSPAGELFYADFDGGTIRRIQFVGANQRTGRRREREPDERSGAADRQLRRQRLERSRRGSDHLRLGSRRRRSSTTRRGTGRRATPRAGPAARLQVTDSPGVERQRSITITVGNTPPTATINAPSSSLTWRVGDVIAFSDRHRSADGEPARSALSWSLILNHCPSNCPPIRFRTSSASSGSVHRSRPRVSVGLQLVLTVTDSGVDEHRERDAAAADGQLDLDLEPLGLQLVLNGASAATPFTRTVIAGRPAISGALAADPEREHVRIRLVVGRTQLRHVITAGATTTYAATYLAPPRNTALPSITGPTMVGKTIKTSNGTWTGSTPIVHVPVAALRCLWWRLRGYSRANATKYLLVAADGVARCSGRPTATNSVSSTSATSAPKAP